MSIYDRQESLSLNTNQSILVCGCGGVGYWVAKFAAMSGIETLYLYDFDVFEEHNLNRIDIPLDAIGKNKAQVTKTIINELRPMASAYALPYKLSDTNVMSADWFVDCTDSLKTQLVNQDIAKKKGMKYVKVGYNGMHMTLSDVVGEWGEAVDGYTIIPSWVVPASTIAALAVAKIMKYNRGEVSTEIGKVLGLR